MSTPQTLFDKVWREHVVKQDAGAPAVLYVDLQQLLGFAGSSGAQLPPELQALRSLVLSSKTSADGIGARLFVTIR